MTKSIPSPIQSLDDVADHDYESAYNTDPFMMVPLRLGQRVGKTAGCL